MRKGALIYIILVGTFFVALTVIFLFLPRSEYSELEKRDLATFPNLKNYSENPSKYNNDISFWFSDTEPYRDVFMTLSMTLRDKIKYKITEDENTITFIANTNNNQNIEEVRDNKEPQKNPLENENAKLANSGILIVGTGPNVRALMTFKGTEKSAQSYVNVINKYQNSFPDINFYAVVIPSSTEYYIPEKAKSSSYSQKAPSEYIKNNINHKIKYVDVYNSLSEHISEDIFLRTDHHWAPLGAYYAAKELARTANVPFKDLSNYNKHVIKNYVGSMYGYSRDISVKNAPEDFIYYKPKNAGEKTSYITYTLDKDFRITAEKGPYPGNFFHDFKDGSGNAYLSYMGGDMHTVKVTTNAPNERKLMIIKDSYGNPVPSFLFYSFKEIHIVDFRYFPKNLRKYIADNKITDIALVFNIFNACSGGPMEKVNKILTQKGGIQETKSNANNEISESKKEEIKSENETAHEEPIKESL